MLKRLSVARARALVGRDVGPDEADAIVMGEWANRLTTFIGLRSPMAVFVVTTKGILIGWYYHSRCDEIGFKTGIIDAYFLVSVFRDPARDVLCSIFKLLTVKRVVMSYMMNLWSGNVKYRQESPVVLGSNYSLCVIIPCLIMCGHSLVC